MKSSHKTLNHTLVRSGSEKCSACIQEKRMRYKKHMRSKGNVNRVVMDKSHKIVGKFKRKGLGILECGKVLSALKIE